MATYTVEEARAIWEKDGDVWTPEVEARLRERGIIATPPPPAAPAAPRPGLSGWQELGAGLGSMIAGPMRGGGLLDTAARTATGTTMGEQVTAGALGGLTAGQVSPADLGIPDPTSVVQRGANLFGQGAGMATAFTPIGKGAGALTAGISNPLARAAVTGGLSFGAYNALAPAEDAGQWAQNVGEGALTGAVLGPLPLLPGVRQVAALPGGRTAIDLAAFTGLGTVHGQDPGTAFLEAIPQLPAMRLVHSAAEGPRRPSRQTPEQSTAAIDALESLLANERAPMQAEVSARVAPFREAQANAQAAMPEVSPAEYNLPIAEKVARAPAPAPAPVEPVPEQYQRTLARIEAMRARQAAPPPEPAPAPAPEPPLARTPAQMEIPLEAPAPVTAYHGGARPIDKFTMDGRNHTTLGGFSRHGISFGDKQTAERYARDFNEDGGAVTEASIRPAKRLDLSATDFEKLQTLQSKADRGEPLTELEDVGLEMILNKHGLAYSPGVSPIDAIIGGGYKIVGKAAGRGGAEAELLVLDESLIDVVPSSAPQPDTVKETRGQRRARLQAEASAVNAGAQARLDTAKRGDVTTDMLGGQQVFEAAARALKETVAEVKDIPRRARNAKAELKTDFAAARSELVRDVAESPGSVPFSRANRGEQTFDEAVKEYAAQPRRVSRVDNLRQYPENATQGVKDIIDSENLSALAHDISKPVADRIDAGFTKELAQKHRGLTDPVRKTQEVYDGELASAGEMSEIHGGREIEMSAYKKAAEIGDRYRDLKTRTGITTAEQMDIAGRLLDRYTSSNRGHAADDLGFVRDPENRRLLVESGNPQGMFEYVRELRRMMDETANLYNAASRASGGDGIGDIAAYFPKVATKPKFFEIGERLARSKARKGADPRTRNTAEEVFNPRSERRSSTDPDKVELDGREVAREWNAERVFEGYIDSMLRGITGDIALSQSIKIAKYMEIKADIAERRGNTAEAEQLRIRANITRNLAQQKWNHQLFGIGARAEDLFKAGGSAGQMALEGLAANKRAFDNTKYRLNPRFNLVTQWTSVLNPTFADPVAALLALRDMGVPGMPTGAKKFAEATYEYRRKAMPHSAMRAQAEGTGSVASTISSPMSGPRKFATVAEKVFFDGLTQGIEAWANKYSALIGYHSTRNLKGLTPRQRALAAGETVFKTQSAFTFGERAGVLNSRAVQGTWPAQGYAVELANQVREALGQTGVDSRLYGETQTQQARRAGAIVAAAVMQNLWQNLIFNAMRGKDIEESFNFDSVWDATLALPPFISILLPTGKSGRDMPNPALPIAQGNMVVNKLGRVAEKVAKGEDATGAVVDATRYGLGNWGGPGGAFASDIMGGRYDFLLGEDEGAGNVPNTVRARPAPARPAKARRAVSRR